MMTTSSNGYTGTNIEISYSSFETYVINAESIFFSSDTFKLKENTPVNLIENNRKIAFDSNHLGTFISEEKVLENRLTDYHLRVLFNSV